MEDKEKKKEIGIQDALEYTQKLINTVHDPTVILYEELIVALTNKSFYQNFNVNPRETEGCFIYKLGNPQCGTHGNNLEDWFTAERIIL